MRALFVNHYAAPPADAGGTRHFGFANEMIRAGDEVSILACAFDHFTHSQRGVSWRPAIEHHAQVPFVWVPSVRYEKNDWRRLANMLVFSLRMALPDVRRLISRPDIIMGSTPHPFAAMAAAHLARSYRVPFVLEVRDLWPESLVALGGFTPGHPAVKMLAAVERFLYRHADAIVTLFPGAGPRFASSGVDLSNVVFVPNGVNLRMVGPPSPVRAHNGIEVVYAGSMGPPNALDTVIDAASLLRHRPDIRITLVGDGEDKAKLKQRATAEHLTNVSFRSPVVKTEVYDLLRSADVLTMAMQSTDLYSRYGMSSNKLWDYMAVARPIAIANAASPDYVAEAGAGLSVPAGDGRELGLAIGRLADMSPQRRWEMGKRGRIYVERERSFEVLTATLREALLNQVQRRKCDQ